MKKTIKKVKSISIAPKETQYGEKLLYTLVATDGDMFTTFKPNPGKKVEDFSEGDCVEIEFTETVKGEITLDEIIEILDDMQDQIDDILDQIDDQQDQMDDQQDQMDNQQDEIDNQQDQLDDIYHNGIDAWKATIKATKDKYPKR